MGLFDSNPPNSDPAYQNMREADHPVQAMLKERLEALWDRYRPYADTNFAQEFALDTTASSDGVESTSCNLVITVEAQDQIIIGRLIAAKVPPSAAAVVGFT